MENFLPIERILSSTELGQLLHESTRHPGRAHPYQEFVAIKKDYPIWGLQSYLTRFFGLLRAQLGSLNWRACSQFITGATETRRAKGCCDCNDPGGRRSALAMAHLETDVLKCGEQYLENNVWFQVIYANLPVGMKATCPIWQRAIVVDDLVNISK